MTRTTSIIIATFIAASVVGCSKPSVQRQSTGSDAMVAFQEFWQQAEMPKLGQSREFWNRKVADRRNAILSTRSCSTVQDELLRISPKAMEHLVVFGTSESIPTAGECHVITIPAEPGNDENVTALVIYMDHAGKTVLLVLNPKEG